MRSDISLKSSQPQPITIEIIITCDRVIQLPLDSCRLLCTPQGVINSMLENAGIFVNFHPLKTQTTNI